MIQFIIRRLLYSLVVVLLASVLVFVLSRMSGDPRYLYVSAYTTQEDWEAWGREMGLDKPIIVQYFTWLGKAVRGDFGDSVQQRKNALDVIIERMPASAQLGLGAFTFAVVTGIPLGVLSAVRRGSILDYLARTFALLGQALPVFWIGLVFILIFAVRLDWLPSGRRGGIDHFILPSICLGWLSAAAFLRLVRSSMLEILDSEFIKFARTKGVRPWVVIWKHAFRNSLIAPLTYGGLLLATWVAGTVVTETVFAWPGLGQLAVQSVFNLDFPVLTGVVLIVAAMYSFANLLVDISYALVDPRIRYQ